MENALKTLFTNCADAIRETLPDVGKMSPNSFPDRIREVANAGGSSDLVKYVTFMSWDGSTELFKMPVLSGDDCKDPITHGDIETPTKESTNTQNFTHSGWALTSGESASSSVLKNVTEDMVVYASYTASVRYYTVNFYDGTTLLETVEVTYGADASELCKPKKDSFMFKSWNPSVSNVTEDINTYAVWEEKVTLETASWTKIDELAQSGEWVDYFKVGDTKTLEIIGKDGTVITKEMQLVDANYDDLSDGSGKAKLTFLSKDSIPTGYNMGRTSTSGSYNGGWEGSYGREVLNGTSNKLGFPSDLLAVVKSVKKSHVEWVDTTYTDVEEGFVNDKFWIPSVAEVSDGGYSVFSNDASRIKYHGSSAYAYSLRDKNVTVSSRNQLYYVTAKGAFATCDAKTSFSVFGFCI